MERGHRQGHIVTQQGYGAEMALYDYSGLGVDLGDEMALYDWGGLGVNLGGVGDYVEQVKGAYDGLPGWIKGAVAVAGIATVVAVATGKVKMASLNPLAKAKKKRNTRKKRKTTTRRRRKTTTRRNRR